MTDAERERDVGIVKAALPSDLGARLAFDRLVAELERSRHLISDLEDGAIEAGERMDMLEDRLS